VIATLEVWEPAVYFYISPPI